MKRDLEAAAQAAPIAVPAPMFLRLVERALELDDDVPFTPRMVRAVLSPDPSIRLDNLPAIGDDFERGRLAGITVHDGAPMALVLLPEDAGEVDWAGAKAFAEKHGGELPTRMDALVLWQNREKLGAWERDYYWTSEQYASDASYAWIQHFSGGLQVCDHTSYEYRARAVRRVPIR